MSIENSILDREETEKHESAVVSNALLSLKAARKMQREKRTYGADHVHLYYEDVEGDWLEKWGEDDSEVEG
jgi:hypothetical protein